MVAHTHLGSMTAADVCLINLGAAYPGCVWNFAYGANMAKEKLSGARGLQPLASKPGLLKGHRMAFNHRGAMGNVMPDAGKSVHGVLHLLSNEEIGVLTNMEHEYWPVEVDVHAYDGCAPSLSLLLLSSVSEGSGAMIANVVQMGSQ